MKLITYPQIGRLGVIIPSDPSLTVEEIAERDVPNDTPFLIIESLDVHDIFDGYLPAFDFDSTLGAVVNIEKAKAIHLDKFRSARTPLLESLDVQYMKAIEVEDSVAASAIAVKKQELRDVTKIILPNTFPEIKEVWPGILN